MVNMSRSMVLSPEPAQPSFHGKPSDFDSGINSSAAWTEHLDTTSTSGTLSDEDSYTDERGGISGVLLPARALYHFEGKAEFRELTVRAGDSIHVLKEDMDGGWSLIKKSTGEVGLLPRTYYTLTSEFIPAPDVELPTSKSTLQESPYGSSNSHSSSAVIPQNTGEWHRMLPSFRQSLLGGKTLNRFSSFVTSGAEEFVLKGTVDVNIDEQSYSHYKDISNSSIDDDENFQLSSLGLGEADRHFVDAGPAWKEKIPSFRVLVHSPSKRRSTFTGAYTVYSVTSFFHSLEPIQKTYTDGSDLDESNTSLVTKGTTPQSSVTVYRRFSHFVVLHSALTRRLPGIAIPPLPDKQYAGRFSEAFVEARRGDLQRYLGRVVRHPVARYAEVVTFFLSCTNDSEWTHLLPQHLSLPAAGATFYARVFHPAFNIDVEDAEEVIQRFEQHIKAVGNGVQGLRNMFIRVREARIEMVKAERLLAYSLLSLITSKPLASVSSNGLIEDDQQPDSKFKHLLNHDGAWCWRENCLDCLRLTKAIQKTSEILHNIADIYEDHARRTQMVTHESLKDIAHPLSLYESVITTHKSTLSRYNEATQGGRTDEEVTARCETVLNTTMAELETYHVQKGDDFRAVMKEHLDGEISFYEQVLQRLKMSRALYDQPQFDELGSSPRQPSIYERELENPRLNLDPLLQPCPHVFDSAPMRPVSVAIQEGVGFLLGPSFRGSVFGKSR